MASVDPQQEARVWQRVRGAVESPPQRREDGLQGLMMEEWASASACLQLARQLPPREKALLQQLFREEQSHAACLKGIFTLMTGRRPVIQTPPPVKEPAEAALRRCYGRLIRSLAEYEKRSSDPEFGPAFARLAEQEREHCRVVLELIGSLQSENESRPPSESGGQPKIDRGRTS